jgi:hypothetical protein
MITDKALLPLLISAKEGDIILAGTLLRGISDEQIAWRVIEVAQLHNRTRVTLHAYWHDIFIVSKVVSVTDGNNLQWGVTKTS